MAEKLDPRWEAKLGGIRKGRECQPRTIDELQGVLRAEKKIKENVWAIEPETVPDGVLGLKKIEDGRWQVILNERGLRLINRTFQNESDACRFFLKSVLDDQTFWTAVPIEGADYHPNAPHIELLARYGFESGEGDTHFWYLLIFVILFLGISIAPLFVLRYSSLWGLMVILAYILGWVFFGFSKVVSRYHRFISYRFGRGTVALADTAYYLCGGVLVLFYVWFLIRFVATMLPPG